MDIFVLAQFCAINSTVFRINNCLLTSCYYAEHILLTVALWSCLSVIATNAKMQ